MFILCNILKLDMKHYMYKSSFRPRSPTLKICCRFNTVCGTRFHK